MDLSIIFLSQNKIKIKGSEEVTGKLILVKPCEKFLLTLLCNFYTYIYTRHTYITFLLTFLFSPCLYFRLSQVTLETWEGLVC